MPTVTELVAGRPRIRTQAECMNPCPQAPLFNPVTSEETPPQTVPATAPHPLPSSQATRGKQYVFHGRYIKPVESSRSRIKWPPFDETEC